MVNDIVGLCAESDDQMTQKLAHERWCVDNVLSRYWWSSTCHYPWIKMMFKSYEQMLSTIFYLCGSLRNISKCFPRQWSINIILVWKSKEHF